MFRKNELDDVIRKMKWAKENQMNEIKCEISLVAWPQKFETEIRDEEKA